MHLERKARKLVLFSVLFFNVHRITLQLLVNQECRTTNLGS